MRHLDSDALTAFLAVSETGSFTAAASRMNKTQAAVSISVARLEERLGHKLFDRLPRRVVLTSTGERLEHYARKILALEDEALSNLCNAGHGGAVRLGMPDDYLQLFGAALLGEFTQRYPAVSIDLRCGFSSQLETMVESREIDIAIVTQSAQAPKGEVLRAEPQVWCAGPGRYPEKAPILRLALFPDCCRARPQILRSLDMAGRRWTMGYSSSSIHGIQLAVASSDMLTVLPESAVPGDWRRLGTADGLPSVPSLALAIYTFQQPRLSVRQLNSFMRSTFSIGANSNIKDEMSNSTNC